MWIIFREQDTAFNNPDKHVLAMVADDDILAYQAALLPAIGGRGYEIMTDVYFLQPLARSSDDVEYFARRYKTWTNASSTV